MKEILILRHAKAEPGSPDGQDRNRPLAPRGVKTARTMGKILRRFDCLPELILCSPASRALETAMLLARAADVAPPTIVESIYGDRASGLRSLLAETPNSIHRVMIVGHNPVLEELVGSLCTPYPAQGRVSMATGTIAALETMCRSWKELAPGCATLLWMLPPRLALAIDSGLESS